MSRALLTRQYVSTHKIRDYLLSLSLVVFCTTVSASEHLTSNAALAISDLKISQRAENQANSNRLVEQATESQKGSLITISGVSGQVLENINAHLGIEKDLLPFSALGFPRSENYIFRKTAEALRVLGYYRPQITIQGDHDRWILTINKGEPVTWSSVNIQLNGEGKSLKQLKDSIDNHPFVIGETIHHGAYSDYKTKVQSIATEYGFFDFTFRQSRMLVDESLNQAHIDWNIDTGVQYRIDAIKLEGSFLSPQFLNRYLEISPGQIYNREQLVKSHQKLNRSGFFKSVFLEQEIDRGRQLVTLVFKIEDIEKYQLKTSIGYGTDSGARLSVNWEDRRFTESGHKYALGFSANQIEGTLFAQYRIPLAGDRDAWINRLSYQRVDDDLALTRLTSYESTLHYYINDHWSSQIAFTIASEEIKENRNISQHIDYLVPSLRLMYSSAIDPFRVDKGWRWQADIRVGSEYLSDPEFRFVQIEQEAKFVWPVTDRWRLIGKGQLGYTAMDDEDFNLSMPTNYRFFSGGDLTVRGYDYQSLTPVDDTGILLGGKHLFNYSVETDYRFMEDFRWAVFYDRGNAFNDWDDTQLKSSAGVGLRWVTPVGSIRLDYARSLDEPNEWRWHITIGPDL